MKQENKSKILIQGLKLKQLQKVIGNTLEHTGLGTS
jgi:hypothetical protein